MLVLSSEEKIIKKRFDFPGQEHLNEEKRGYVMVWGQNNQTVQKHAKKVVKGLGKNASNTKEFDTRQQGEVNQFVSGIYSIHNIVDAAKENQPIDDPATLYKAIPTKWRNLLIEFMEEDAGYEIEEDKKKLEDSSTPILTQENPD